MRSNIVSFIKWLSARIGYSIAMVKTKDGVIYIEGDRNLINYFDVSGFISKAPPLKRAHDKTYTYGGGDMDFNDSFLVEIE